MMDKSSLSRLITFIMTLGHRRFKHFQRTAYRGLIDFVNIEKFYRYI